MSSERSHIRIWLLVAGGWWLVSLAAAHALDVRNYYADVAEVLSKSLAWIDAGEFSWLGSHYFFNLNLGPLSHVLAAIPLSLSRDVHLQYYFSSLLVVLSVVVYGTACFRLFTDRLAAWLSVAAFAYFILLIHLPIE
ncbi:MAG: hypothetical protein ACTSXZ_02400, partial [Alphaproteobacteria bacterium]